MSNKMLLGLRNLYGIMQSRYCVIVLKAICSVIAIVGCVYAFGNYRADVYVQEKVYDYKNDFSDESVVVELSSSLEQEFIAKGQELTSFSIYLQEIADENVVLDVGIKNSEGEFVFEKDVNASDLAAGEWNTINVEISNLVRGEIYTLCMSTKENAGGIFVILDSNLDGAENLQGCYGENVDAGMCVAVGIHQVYRYYTLPYILLLVVDILLLGTVVATLLYVIWNIKKCVSNLMKENRVRSFSYGIILALIAIMIYNPMDSQNTQLESFSRIIGNGVAYGYDVSRVIANFNMWFALFVICTFAFSCLVANLQKYSISDETKSALCFLDDFMVLAGVNLVLRGITFFNDGTLDGNEFYYSSYIIILTIVFVFVYTACGLEKYISFSSYGSLALIIFSIAFAIAVVLKAEWEYGMLLLGMQTLCMAVAVLLIKFTKISKIFKQNYSLVFSGTVVAGCLPLALSLYIELANILAGRGIFIAGIRRGYVVSLLILFLVFVIMSMTLKHKGECLPDEKSIVAPMLIFGIAALSVQVPLTGTYSANLMESANSSVLISDFLNFGEVPIVSHYGGHMMTGVWEGIIYGIVNNDYVGAAFNPYSGHIAPIIILIFYFLLREVWNEKDAFFSVLLLPFYSSISYYAQGLLIVLAIIAFIKKNTYVRAMLIWLACVWCTLYRLDMGYSFDISAVIALVGYCIYRKDNRIIKQLLIMLGVCVAVFGLLWLLLCFKADINPINRLIEFIEISASNQNWAYEGIGDTSKLGYFWCYFAIPFVMLGSLFYVALSRKFREKIGVAFWCVLIAIGVAYFANFARGLVRHSLAESSYTVVLWSAYLYLALMIAGFLEKKFISPVFFGLVLINQLFVSGANFASSSISDLAGSKINSILNSWQVSRIEYEDAVSDEERMSYWEKIAEENQPIDRVVVNGDLLEEMKPLEIIVDTLLSEEETYIDFMNHTFIYSYLQKRNPVYVSQSPLQLSGEYTQEQFVAEIEENKNSIPIAILPYDNSNDYCAINLDGVANAYRYYIVSEYIYQNYVPLCHYEGYAVWCLRDRYDDMLEKIINGTECISVFSGSSVSFLTAGMDIEVKSDKIILTGIGEDPILANFDEYLDLSCYVGDSVKITVVYQADKDGVMQIFYTDEENEEYSREKCVSCNITAAGGQAEFVVPISEYTKLRLDIPTETTVTISSVKLAAPIEAIAYGYDRISNMTDTANYIDGSSSLHTYSINQLAYVWGELDENEAVLNPVVTRVYNTEGDLYHIDSANEIDKTEGNYLYLSAEWYGDDAQGYTQSNDETINAVLRMGIMEAGIFVEKYRYTLTLKEGEYDYLIRISSDYFWYADNIDTIMLDFDEKLWNVNMSILQGD